MTVSLRIWPRQRYNNIINHRKTRAIKVNFTFKVEYFPIDIYVLLFLCRYMDGVLFVAMATILLSFETENFCRISKF